MRHCIPWKQKQLMNIRAGIQMAFCIAGEFSLTLPNHETVGGGETCHITENQLLAESFLVKRMYTPSSADSAH